MPSSPTILSLIPVAVDETGNPVLIGTVTPAQAGDALTLSYDPTSLFGTLSLSGTSVFYTPTPGGPPVTEQISYTVSEAGAGTSAVQAGSFVVVPAPAVTAVSLAAPVEVGQSVVIGTVAVTLPHDPLTLTHVSGAGTVTLGAVANGVQQILYTAPAGTAGVAADAVSYTVTDGYGLSAAAQTVTVALDPGLSYVASTPNAVEGGESTVIAVLTPGLPGDTLTLTAMNKAAAAGLSIGPVRADGTEQLIYTAPAGVTASHVTTLDYTVEDQHVGGQSFVTSVSLNAGLVLTPVVPTGNLENGQSVVIGSLTADLPGDVLTLTPGSGLLGTVSLGAANASGVQQVLYTAPPHIHANSIENVSYTITDSHGSPPASGSASVQLDFGVTITSTGPVILNAGQSAVVDTITAGLPGDVVTFTKTFSNFGNFTLEQTGGSATTPNTYTVTYHETAAFSASQRDYATYQVEDRAGGKLAGDGPVIRLQAGPRFVTTLASVAAAPGQTVDVGVVSGGLSGDVLTIVGGAKVPGTFSLSALTSSGFQGIFYTAPSTVAIDGPVALSYKISDQQGHAVTGKTSAVLTNSLPVITNQVATVLKKGQTEVIGTVKPGAAVDTLTLAQTGAASGTVSLVNVAGVIDVVYTAASAIAASGADHVGYTVTDEHGGSVSGSATVPLDAGPTVAPMATNVVVKGQSTVIGTVSPGLVGDTLSLTQAPGSQGVVSLSGSKVIYTAAGTVMATGTDTVSYTVSDQYHDATASGTSTVNVYGATPVNSSAPITSTTVGDFIDLAGGSPAMTFKGANSTVLLEGSSRPTITDSTSYLTIDVGSAGVSAVIKGLGADGHGVIDLLYGVGGFTTVSAVLSALKADGAGGSRLWLGSGLIDIAGLPPTSVPAAYFKIG